MSVFASASNPLTVEEKDDLSLSYKDKIAKEANDVAENAGKTQIFEFDNDVGLNENIPGVNMSFLNRLFHQLTRPSVTEFDCPSDEEFAEIDETEIIAVTNNNIEQPMDDEDNSKESTSLQKLIRSFIEELGEETDVIRGRIDDEALFNRRSRRARVSSPFIENKQNILEQELISFSF